MIHNPQLVRVQQARQMTGLPVSKATVNRLIRLGKIPATRIGGVNYVDPEQLRAALVSDPAVRP